MRRIILPKLPHGQRDTAYQNGCMCGLSKFFFSSRWLGWIFYSSEATLIWNECFLPFVWPERTKFGGESVLNQWKLFVSFDYFSIFIKFAYFIFLNTFDSNHFHLSIRWRKNCFNSFGKFKNDRKKNTLLTTQRESR